MSLITRKISERLHLFMAVPALCLFAFFFVYPLAQGIRISLTDWTGFSKTYDYIGLQNFVDFFQDDRALHALRVTLTFGLVSPLLLCALGLIYALILDQKLVGGPVVRTIVYVPAIISPLIMGFVWQLILTSDNGALRQILHALRLDASYQDFLGNPTAALWVIILINAWQFVGYPMIIFLAGLQSIPQELQEAARIDGAGYLAGLRYVTLPLLMPAIQINVITNLIGSLAVFDVIVALTGGGPGTSTESIGVYIYHQSFGGQMGYATAVAVLLFFVMLIPVAAALYLTKRGSYEF